MARLSLTLLGGFRARLVPGAPLVLPTRKAQALLAYLVVPAGPTHSRDKLASLLWGSTVETTARTSLRNALYALRKSLRESDGQPLRVDGETVACDPAAVTVDVGEFERLASEATPEALAEAAALYQGDLLEGLTVQEPSFEDWLLAQRERLHEMAIMAFNRLLVHQRAAGATEAAVQVALRLLALDPLQEPVHRALMQLYVETGRRGAALRQYQLWVATLQRELRTEPDAETKALYQEILRRGARGRVDVESRIDSRGPDVTEAPTPGEPPLVGRQRELARLEAVLESSLAGHGRLVVLIGEAGTGKSRLLTELTARATRRRGRVLIGRCYESERILPFAPWVDALRTGHVVEERELLGTLEPGWRAELGRLLPELSGTPRETASPPGGEPVGRAAGDARHLFEAIGELLMRLARRRPLVVVLEDLHWADEMSLRFLAFLGRRLPAVPLLVLATASEEELADSALLRQTLNELEEGERLLRVPLGPLSRADTAALIRVLAPPGIPDPLLTDLASEAWRASDGNAFVVVEVMHALRQGAMVAGAQHLSLPARVRQLVRQRLERLSERGRRLVAAAAVIGRRFDFPLLQRATELSEREAAEGVEELVRHRVLRGAGEGLEFSHDYIREVATAELSPPIRVVLHRRVADSLEQLSGEPRGAQALALGTHYRQGEVWDKATLHFREAGRHAATHSAHHEAVACYEEALGTLRHLPESRETLARNLGLRIDLRQSLYPLGRFADLRDHLREAERLAETLEDRLRLGQVSAYASNYHWITGDLPRALESGQRALALAGALADHGLTVEANFRLGQAHWSLGQYGRAVAFFERCGTAGKPQTSEEGLGQSAWPAELGLAELSLYWLAPPLTELGRFEEAVAAATRALEFATWAERPFALVGAFAGIGLANLYQGRFDEAVTALTRGLEVCRRWDLSVHRPWSAAALGYTYALAGKVPDGLALLGEAVDEAEKLGLASSQAWRLAWLGEASLLAGRPDDAARCADQALEQSRQRGERGHVAWALRAQAEVASAREDPAARERYEEALALARGLAMRPLGAHCHLGLGRLYRRAGDGTQAREHLTAAATMYREMDMELFLRQAEEA